MLTSFDEFLASLPADRREAIGRETAAAVAKEYALRELRKVRRCSQQQIAERLGVNQAAVSKLEKRADMYLSTLRQFVEAAGGKLELVARFPDHPPLRIGRLGAIGDPAEAEEAPAVAPNGPTP